MSRFAELQNKMREGRKLLVPFITGNYPDKETFVNLLLCAQESGADALEVGIPFSDPSADGPVIQNSSKFVLEAGVTTAGIMESVALARSKGLTIPLLYMTYYNPILAKGGELFSSMAVKSGADGVLVVDLPPEEADEFAPIAKSHGLDTIFIVAPTTPEDRIGTILSYSSGFVYIVSVTGVTGGKSAVADTVGATCARVKPKTDLPVIVGFGVTGPESAKAIGAVSDGVIVGSALISEIGQKTGAAATEAAGLFLSSIRRALDLA